MSIDHSHPRCAVCGEAGQPLYQAPRDVTDRYPFRGFRHVGHDNELRWYCAEHRPQSFEVVDE